MTDHDPAVCELCQAGMTYHAYWDPFAAAVEAIGVLRGGCVLCGCNPRVNGVHCRACLDDMADKEGQ